MVKASINQLSVKCQERSVREDPVLRTSCKSNTSWRILVWNTWVAFRIPNACYLCIAFGEIRHWKLPTVTEGPWRGLLFIFSPMETLDTWLIIDCYSLKLSHVNYYLPIFLHTYSCMRGMKSTTHASVRTARVNSTSSCPPYSYHAELTSSCQVAFCSKFEQFSFPELDFICKWPNCSWMIHHRVVMLNAGPPPSHFNSDVRGHSPQYWCANRYSNSLCSRIVLVTYLAGLFSNYSANY